MNRPAWKLRLGATVAASGVFFRVWAPASKSVEVVPHGGPAFSLRRGTGGYFSGFSKKAGPGTLYRYRLDDGSVYADPCSRFQPQGPLGPSMVVDPGAFRWSRSAWAGTDMRGQVIYEMHIGTFTPEGTFDAAIRQLSELKKIGITLLEILPIAEWAGTRNWGYDGVNYFAPTRCYGDAAAFKRFVDAAHRLQMGVVLDVVYNHFGPAGNFLPKFSPRYVSERHTSEWGPIPNFDGPHAGPVREFFLQNACYWIAEFHLDGLRLDATQGIIDSSRIHFLAELSTRVRAAAGNRKIVLIAENEPQHTKLVRPHRDGGYGLDALWADDFHHAARVALNGFREAYFTDYRGTARELLAASLRGYLFQGQHYRWQKQPRGMPTRGVDPSAFVFYLQNHDQVANHFRGVRAHFLGPAALYRALTALLLLSPSTPLLFMGQEFGSSSPFHFFVDHSKDLSPLVDSGRRGFFVQFPSYKPPEVQKRIPAASALSSFERSKLDFSERRKHAQAYRFHRDLLALRRRFGIGFLARSEADGAVLSERAFVLRYFRSRQQDLLLAVNLGKSAASDIQSEPLLAPPSGKKWHLTWQSGGKPYGGRRAFRPSPALWKIPGHTAQLFAAR